jgi:hypothetical protein
MSSTHATWGIHSVQTKPKTRISMYMYHNNVSSECICTLYIVFFLAENRNIFGISITSNMSLGCNGVCCWSNCIFWFPKITVKNMLMTIVIFRQLSCPPQVRSDFSAEDLHTRRTTVQLSVVWYVHDGRTVRNSNLKTVGNFAYHKE